MSAPDFSRGRQWLAEILAVKGRAFLIHLLSSTAAFAALLAVAVKFWYPLPYFFADGGWHGLRLVLAVDLVLGPLLTLIVYHPAKRRAALLLDYSVIALLQILAFALGVATVFSQRTVLVVFSDGAFYSVDAETSVRAGGKVPEILARAETRPAYAVIRMPPDREAQQRLRKESLALGRPLFLMGERAEPLSAAVAGEALGKGVDLEALVRQDPERRREIERFLDGRKADLKEFLFYPLSCRYRSLTVALWRDSGAVAGFLRLSFGPGGKLVPESGRPKP